MSTQDNQHTWTKIITEDYPGEGYILDAWDWLIFKRFYWKCDHTYTARYNWITIRYDFGGVFYEWDWYWYSCNPRSMQKYHFDKLIFEIKNL